MKPPTRKSINYLAKGGKTERGSIRGEVRGGEEWAESFFWGGGMVGRARRSFKARERV